MITLLFSAHAESLLIILAYITGYMMRRGIFQYELHLDVSIGEVLRVPVSICRSPPMINEVRFSAALDKNGLVHLVGTNDRQAFKLTRQSVTPKDTQLVTHSALIEKLPEEEGLFEPL